jgi:hypothetical protein
MKTDQSFPLRAFVAASLLCLATSALVGCGQGGSITGSPSLGDGVLGDPNPNPTPTPNPNPTPAPTPTPAFEKMTEDITVAQEKKKLDILVVMDNSRSMAYEQSNMSQRFESFLDKIANLDWQIGITSTDMSGTSGLRDGRLALYGRMGKHLISSKDNFAEAKRAFSETIQLSTNGDGHEQGVRSTFRALQRSVAGSTENRGLVRADAALALIVVTDDDENRPPNEQMSRENSPQELVKFVNETWTGKAFKFHSIIVKPGDVACLNRNEAGDENENFGVNYHVASQITDGIVGSVCENDYSKQLAAIGESSADLIKTLKLKCEPQDQNQDGKVDLTLKEISSSTEINEFEIAEGQKLILKEPLKNGTYKLEYFCKKKEEGK